MKISLPYIILLLLVISSLAHSVARLGISPKMLRTAPNRRERQQLDSTDSDLKMFHFHQNLDHFTFTPQSYMAFQQRYAIEFKHWAGAEKNAPILAFLGEESPLEYDLSAIGFLRDNGPRLKALLVYIEILWEDNAMAFGSAKETLKNASTLGYLNSAQALADYAAVLLHIKEKYSAKHCPIIVIGGSYGGMLAAWFRLKYPHIALGALASSAPLLYFQDTLPKHGYYYVVTKVFKETSERCYNTIRKSWEEIDRVAAKPNGLLVLSKLFRTCNSLNDTSELKGFLDTIYCGVVQYNDSFYSVASLCEAINASPPNSKIDLLGQIFAGVVDYMRNISCYDTSVHPTDDIAWKWQSCSEIVMPIGYDEQDTMFQTKPFNMRRKIENCESQFGVPPRPHWATAYYGIQDVKLILRRFGRNIIFSNGLSDPYSVGGILEDISATVVAITTQHGSHCQDIALKSKDDPEWLLLQRRKEIEMIESWILTYKRDLRDLNISMV